MWIAFCCSQDVDKTSCSPTYVHTDPQLKCGLGWLASFNMSLNCLLPQQRPYAPLWPNKTGSCEHVHEAASVPQCVDNKSWTPLGPVDTTSCPQRVHKPFDFPMCEDQQTPTPLPTDVIRFVLSWGCLLGCLLKCFPNCFFLAVLILFALCHFLCRCFQIPSSLRPKYIHFIKRNHKIFCPLGIYCHHFIHGAKLWGPVKLVIWKSALP